MVQDKAKRLLLSCAFVPIGTPRISDWLWDYVVVASWGPKYFAAWYDAGWLYRHSMRAMAYGNVDCSLALLYLLVVHPKDAAWRHRKIHCCPTSTIPCLRDPPLPIHFCASSPLFLHPSAHLQLQDNDRCTYFVPRDLGRTTS